MNRVPIDRIAPMCVLQGQCQVIAIVRDDDQMHVIRATAPEMRDETTPNERKQRRKWGTFRPASSIAS
jgi:hypothetical protein